MAGTSGNAVTTTAWVQLQGLYTYTTDVSGLVLYLESSSATSQYYLDDFTIVQVAPPASSVVQHGFEDSTVQGWAPRGTGVALSSVTTIARTGTRSLRTTGRTVNWNGPSLDMHTLLARGAAYQVSGYVRLVAGQAPTDLIFTVERTPVGGTAQFDRVAATPANGVTDAAWVQLQGQYSYTSDVSGLVLYLESSSATSQYYLDDFSITLVAPPPALSALVDYHYSLVAVDTAGNVSAPARAMVRAYDGTPPLPPTISRLEWVRVRTSDGAVFPYTDPIPSGEERLPAVRVIWIGASAPLEARVQRRSSATAAWQTAMVWTSGKQDYPDKDVESSQSYQFRVQARNSSGMISSSAVVSIAGVS